jgi:hypothetical protein
MLEIPNVLPKHPTVINPLSYMQNENEMRTRPTIASNTEKALREQISQRWACTCPAINPTITWASAVLLGSMLTALWIRFSLHWGATMGW